jgi:hypothetical protein
MTAGAEAAGGSSSANRAVKASDLPSGDHATLSGGSSRWVMRRSAAESIRCIQIWRFPSRSDK